MAKRRKHRVSISVAGLLSAFVLTGCSTDSDTKINQSSDTPVAEDSHSNQAPALSLEPEAESDSISERTDLNTDDMAYLTQLALTRGHLFVGKQLYKAGHVDHAKTHMQHPESELYADIEPALTFRGSPGFAAELQALANAVETEQGESAVEEAYQTLTRAISASEALVDESSNRLASRLKLAAGLMRIAADEYAVAVVDGEMQNAHEYQDALGFVHVANRLVSSTQPEGPQGRLMLEQVAEIFASLKPLWPNLIPPDTLDTRASQLRSAASKVELLALGLN